MKRVVVTGANGFVGSAVVRALCQRGHAVTAIVRSADSDCGRIAGLCPIIACDLSEYSHLPDRVGRQPHDVFLHFAWTGLDAAQRKDYTIQLTNAKYAGDAVKASSALGCSMFVFAGSIMQYEFLQSIDTISEVYANSCYSIAKIAATQLTRTLARTQNMGYINAIISNVYGPGEESARFIYTMIKKLLRNERVPVTEAKQNYDFIYIDDAANAFCSIVESGKAYRDYYIGSENPRPLKEFLEEVQQQFPSSSLDFGKIALTSVSLDYQKLFDLHALRKDTGFSCRVPFSVGIQRTVQYLQQKRNLAQLYDREECRDPSLLAERILSNAGRT